MKPLSITARAARWFLPLTCVAVLSATVTWATDQALATNPLWTQPATGQSAWASPTALTGTVVILSSRNPDGYAINILCSTDAGRSAADSLEIDALELASVISNLCTSSSQVGVTAN
jgi:hypothetical protein